jgi:hypothetical protein
MLCSLHIHFNDQHVSLAILSTPKVINVCSCVLRQHWVEAFLYISLAFDFIAFAIILFLTMRQIGNSTRSFSGLLHVMQRDGIIYFIVLVTSNLTWLILLLDARVSLRASKTHYPAQFSPDISQVSPQSVSLFLSHAFKFLS